MIVLQVIFDFFNIEFFSTFRESNHPSIPAPSEMAVRNECRSIFQGTEACIPDNETISERSTGIVWYVFDRGSDGVTVRP